MAALVAAALLFVGCKQGTIAGRLSGYSFDLFKGTAYTHDTPWMHNFDSRRPNFGL